MTDATVLLAGLEERLYERRGAVIRTFEGGEGPPLLLVHGFGGAAWNFSELGPLLPGRRLIIPDLPGHGASSPLPAPTLAGFADVVAEILDEPMDVLGHSMGGVVALRLAARHPMLARSLIPAAAGGNPRSTRVTEVPFGLPRILPSG